MISWEDLVLNPRKLYGLAAGLALLGLGLRLAPSRLPRVQPVRDLAAAAQPSQSQVTVADERSYAPIATQNVFSQTRTPPPIRFVPEGRPAPAPATAAPRRPRQPVFRLYGITAGASGTIALIDADPKIRGAELYRVGDRVGNGRITNITDSTVVISRAGGSLTLRLPSNRRSSR
jgi:type II secretion system (T2SS) protein C